MNLGAGDGPDLLLRTKAVILGVDATGVAEVIEDGAILIRGGLIGAVGAGADLAKENPGVAVGGGPDLVALPGLVNAHHHFGLTPLMLGVPFGPLELWLPQFRGMRQIGLRLDTLYSAIEMLESGTTTVQHIQGGLSGHEDGWHRTVDAVVDAYREIGMRVSWSFMIRDCNQLVYDDDAAFLATLPADIAGHFGVQLSSALAPVARHMAFFEDASRRWRARDADGVRLQLAPANLHWCTDKTLEAIFGTARRNAAKVHMHLVETERQAAFARERTGRSAVAHLDALGCLGPELTIGHGIWCSGTDLDLLAARGCSVCHNASSGLRLASGIAPVTEMHRRGIPVALGIDQSNLDDDRDMFAEMRLVFALHRQSLMFGPRPTPAEILKMATEHGAATTGFAGRIGRLAPGMAADIVTVDWRRVARPQVEARTPLVDALVLRSRKDMVRSVYVDGREVVRNGRVVAIDRDAVMDEIAARLALSPSPQEEQAVQMVDRLMPHLEAWFAARQDPGTGRAYRYNAIGDE